MAERQKGLAWRIVVELSCGPDIYGRVFQQLWHRLLGSRGRPASESGSLCRDGGGSRTGRPPSKGAKVGSLSRGAILARMIASFLRKDLRFQCREYPATDRADGWTCAAPAGIL